MNDRSDEVSDRLSVMSDRLSTMSDRMNSRLDAVSDRLDAMSSVCDRPDRISTVNVVSDRSGKMNTHISLCVTADESISRQRTIFRIKRDSVMSKLFGIYCNSKGLKRGSLIFTIRNRVILGTETPNSVQLNDGDIITASRS